MQIADGARRRARSRHHPSRPQAAQRNWPRRTVACRRSRPRVGRSTTASDLFSLGILLYEMATGERPFRGESVVSVLSSILRDVPRPLAELNPRLPREFTRIVRRCLAKDPDERYQSAKDLRLDLEDLRQERGSSEQSRAAAPDPRTTSIRRRAAVAGLVTRTAGAVAAWLWRRGGPPSAERAVLTHIDRVTGEPGIEGAPSVSPDGHWIVYSRQVDGVTRIYLQAVGGDRPLNLTPDGAGGGLFIMGRTGELVRKVSDAGYCGPAPMRWSRRRRRSSPRRSWRGSPTAAGCWRRRTARGCSSTPSPASIDPSIPRPRTVCAALPCRRSDGSCTSAAARTKPTSGSPRSRSQ